MGRIIQILADPHVDCLKYCLHQASSRIIGRGGAFIKQLQRESGCKINTLKDVDLRSGLKARVMNVCGTNSAMSKGIYLIARKIASRWEYAPEWQGGDPTVPSGQGLPPSSTSSMQTGGSRGADQAGFSSMDVDSGGENRRNRGGQRARGSGRGMRGRGEDPDSQGSGRHDRDSSRSERRSGDSDNGSRGDRSSGRDSGRYGRSGRDAPAAQAPSPASTGKRSQGSTPAPAANVPWAADPALLASVVSGTTAPPGSQAAVASAEAWQRLLGQIPSSARESLGIGAIPVTAAAGAADAYSQLLATQQQLQQQQQAQQVRNNLFALTISCCTRSMYAHLPCPTEGHRHSWPFASPSTSVLRDASLVT